MQCSLFRAPQTFSSFFTSSCHLELSSSAPPRGLGLGRWKLKLECWGMQSVPLSMHVHDLQITSHYSHGKLI